MDVNVILPSRVVWIGMPVINDKERCTQFLAGEQHSNLRLRQTNTTLAEHHGIVNNI